MAITQSNHVSYSSMPLPLLALPATPHPALLYGNMPMQQKSRPLRSGFLYCLRMPEAGYSSIVNEPAGVAGSRQKKEIHRARIYCISGYYDENEKYIQRPDCLTKVYHSLVRYVKKIAPYTEFTVILISMKDENYGEEYEYRHKEYITKNCLDLINNKGYKLC